jgi:hypothetical protein
LGDREHESFVAQDGHGTPDRVAADVMFLSECGLGRKRAGPALPAISPGMISVTRARPTGRKLTAITSSPERWAPLTTGPPSPADAAKPTPSYLPARPGPQLIVESVTIGWPLLWKKMPG